MIVDFDRAVVTSEDEALALLPSIRGKVEFKEIKWGKNENQLTWFAETKSINAVIILYYMKYYYTRYNLYGDTKGIDGISWVGLEQNYPYSLHIYLYYPFWALLAKVFN